jgi:hypothetical protein
MLDTTDGKGCTLGTKEKYSTVMQPLEFDDVETVHKQFFHHLRSTSHESESGRYGGQGRSRHHPYNGYVVNIHGNQERHHGRFGGV